MLIPVSKKQRQQLIQQLSLWPTAVSLLLYANFLTHKRTLDALEWGVVRLTSISHGANPIVVWPTFIRFFFFFWAEEVGQLSGLTKDVYRNNWRSHFENESSCQFCGACTALLDQRAATRGVTRRTMNFLARYETKNIEYKKKLLLSYS